MAEGEAERGADGAAHEVAGRVDKQRWRVDRLLRGSGVVVLIGLVTLSGALLTWVSLGLGGQASDADRRSILDTTSQQRAQLAAESQVQFDVIEFARYRADLVAAAAFRSAAASSSDAASAASLAATAQSLQALADTRKATGAVNAAYVSGSSPNELVYEVGRRRRDLERQNPFFETRSVDPALTRRQADRLHDRSLSVGLAVVALGAMVALLTVAEFARGNRRRILAGLGGFGAVAITVAALLGPGY